MTDPIVFDYPDRPDIEVLVDGTWLTGVLHAWFWHHDGSWTAHVRYCTGAGENHLEMLPSEYVRRIADDASR